MQQPRRLPDDFRFFFSIWQIFTSKTAGGFGFGQNGKKFTIVQFH